MKRYKVSKNALPLFQLVVHFQRQPPDLTVDQHTRNVWQNVNAYLSLSLSLSLSLHTYMYKVTTCSEASLLYTYVSTIHLCQLQVQTSESM